MRVRVYKKATGRFDVLCEFRGRTKLTPVMTKDVDPAALQEVLEPMAAYEERIKAAIREARGNSSGV